MNMQATLIKPAGVLTKPIVPRQAELKMDAGKTPIEKVQTPSGLPGVIAALDEIMRRAMAAAGCTTEKQFSRLSRQEQNAFLAEARGLQAMPMRDGVQMLDPETIEESPFNRENFDPVKLDDLIGDVKEHGVSQNGSVRPLRPPRGKIVWQLIVGERRWRAARAAKKLFPATVQDVGDTEAIELQLMENVLREDLNAIDEATKYHQLLEAYEGEGLTRKAAMERLEKKMGKGTSRSTIYERLALLELPAATKKAVLQGRLPASHAGLLTKLDDPKTVTDLTKQIIAPKSGEDDAGVMNFRGANQIVKEAVDREKHLADWMRMAGEFRASGLVVLTPAECRAAVPRDAVDVTKHFSVEGNYVGPFTDCELPGSGYREYGKLWKKEPPMVLARTPNGTPVIIYERDAADLAVQAGGKLIKCDTARGNGYGSGSTTSDAEREKNRNHKRRLRDFGVAIEAILDAKASSPGQHAQDGLELQRLMTRCMVRQWRYEPLRRTIARRGWQKGGNFADTIEREMAGMTIGELRGLMLEILLFHEAPSADGKSWGETLTSLCALCGIELPPWTGK